MSRFKFHFIENFKYRISLNSAYFSVTCMAKKLFSSLNFIKNKRKLKSNFVDRVAYGEKSNENCEPFGFFEGLLASYYKSVQELGQTKIETFLSFQVVLL